MFVYSQKDNGNKSYTSLQKGRVSPRDNWILTAKASQAASLFPPFLVMDGEMMRRGNNNNTNDSNSNNNDNTK